MDYIRWVLASVLLFMALWVGLANWYIVFTAYFRKKPTGSWSPLLSGVCGAVGLLLLPVEGVKHLAWMPLLLDWGSLPGITVTIVQHLFRLRQ